MNTPHIPIEGLAGVGIASAAVLEIFGIPLQPIVWALIGGVLGAGAAPPAKWWVSIGIYLSASLCSALIGHAAAAQWLGGSPLAGNATATIVAIFFHPLLAAGAQRVPEIFGAVLGMLSRRGQP